MIFDKDAILGVQDTPVESVQVPEWGKDARVYVRALGAADQVAFSECMHAEENNGKMYIALALTWFICDEAGERILAAEDADALSKKRLTALARIYGVAKRLNGLDIESEAKK